MEFFEPIAIVGQGCVLPGALDPEQLWELVARGADQLGEPPPDYWGLDPARVQTTPDGESMDRTWATRGGYVRGFEEAFDPSGFALDAELIQGLDPLFQWSLEAARQAWRSAGLEPGARRHGGVILGNLSYPTRALSGFAEAIWRGQLDRAPDAHNRYMSGLPAHLSAQALGLEGASFCLDAACASSLYAIKLACDRLHDGRADVMLAGGVNHADDLFLHIGFCALNAMSRTGQSRPFHQGADGLIPAEGAGFVVLKRLDDARRDGDEILGLVRGVGLSNDGRGRGLLTPSEDGQWRAVRQAYEMSGLNPEDISMIECHATGTPLGDATELRSMARHFEGQLGVPIASLKSNLGHLITASGVAGLLKTLAAMRHQVRPATLHVDEPIDWIDETPFRLLAEPEPWNCEGPRRAGINNFGFGGNNAHLIVEEWDGQYLVGRSGARAFAERRSQRVERAPEESADPASSEIAVVGLSVIVGEHEDAQTWRDALLEGAGERAPVRCVDEITFDVTDLRFPPRDLEYALPQQLLALRAGLELKAQIGALDSERTGVYMGMQCDTEIARYGARWRLGAGGRDALEDQALEARRDGVVSGLVAAGVLGTMPNIVANRLNSQFDIAGPSYTVSSEELSGVAALELAARALRSGELDAALVGAVELGCDPVHQAAAEAILPEDRHQMGDAAVVMLVKRREDAERDGDTIWALLPDPDQEHSPSRRLGLGQGAMALTQRFGHAHAASGLLHVAAAAILCRHRAALHSDADPATPWLPSHGQRVVAVPVEAAGDQRHELVMRCAPPDEEEVGYLPAAGSRLWIFGAEDRQQLDAALAAGQAGGPGRWRVCLEATPGQLGARLTAAREALSGLEEVAEGLHELADGIYLGRGELDGEVAFVFTGPAGAYPGMGRELGLALPGLVDEVASQFDNLDEAVGWIYEPGAGRDRPPVDKLWGSSYLSQLHARLTRRRLGIRAQAAIGFCSGETNALFAMGAWRGLDQMHADIERGGVFDRALGGDFEVLRQSWDLEQGDRPDWQTWRILARPEAVREALEPEERAHLTIINGPADVVIAGEAQACERVVERVGAQRARHLGYNIVMHCPEARAFSEAWRDLHHRPTEPVEGVRFYTNATLSSYGADAERVADALTGQAMDTVDFPALIERAWDDGVRVFLEHGPQSGCTRWIGQTLGDRPHLAVALDEYHRADLAQINDALAQLIAAGVPCDWQAWPGTAQPEASQSETSEESARSLELSFPAHLPPVDLTGASGVQEKPVRSKRAATTTQGQLMSPPPSIAPTLPDVSALSLRAPVVEPEPEAPASKQVFASTPASEPAPRARVEPAPSRPQPRRQAPAAPVASTSGAGEGRFQGRFAEVSRVHREYLARQTSMQRRFLESRQRLNEAFARAMKAARRGESLSPEALERAADALAARRTAASLELVPRPGGRVSAEAPAVPAPSFQKTPVRKEPGPAARSNDVAHGPNNGVAVRAPSLGTPDEVVEAPAPPETAPPEPEEKAGPIGPTFDYEDLKIHASGKISKIFGPMFERQDDWDVQVRMPEPPLLLCHRVTGIDCTKGVVDTGTLWCESDVPADAWYLHQGRMPVGIMIESGQADLMLISWMGADFENAGERVYRLLGCELTFHEGGLPQPGDTLAYDIHINGHARQGPVRLFFFSYDCTIGESSRLSVRHGQAGFFTYEELSESRGVLWTPEDEDAEAIAEAPFDAHPAVTAQRSFGADEVQEFAEGRVWKVFGEGFERAAAHSRTPSIQPNEMRFMDEVTEFDPSGGPWGRGYLRAVQHISLEDWFFDGHFKNDPCMPGTLMFEGCVQVMAFYMSACGWTLDRDGWVFEPVPEQPYLLRCRGQVDPSSREVVYEVFVREVHDGPTPKLFADLMCTVDGLKAFHCGRMGLQLAPDWPMDELAAELLDGHIEPVPVATSSEGHAFGYDSLLACAWGRPTRAFGQMYEPFDSHRKVARLPGPPYHFISRILEVDPEAQGAMESGCELVVEYDVPSDAWYFEENGAPVMPYAVLLEAGLQPCGWLASYVGCALTRDIDLFFRNLDGTSNLHMEVTPETGTLRSHITLRNIARAGGNIIVAFDVDMRTRAGDPVFEMDTVFGFFLGEALAAQIGLPVDEELRTWHDTEPERVVVDLTERPARYCEGSLRLAEPMLLMFDRITAWEPDGGEFGLGRARGVKDVDPSEWFFEAHFFQDPVQPGSLGLEALAQLLQWAMIERDMGQGLDRPRFEAVAVDEDLTWKYRGQVLTHNERITSTLEIVEVGEDERGVWARARGSLWVDGARIYHADPLVMRIVEGGPGPRGDDALESAEAGAELSIGQLDTARAADTWEPERELVLDPEEDTWLQDHRPTYTRPALPMMSVLDLMAQQVERTSGHQVVSMSEVRIRRWLIVDGPTRLRARAEPLEGKPGRYRVALDVWFEAPRPEMSRWDEVASGSARVDERWRPAPGRLEPLQDARPAGDLYASGELFHGPAFQVLERVRRGSNGASSTLRVSEAEVPVGALHPALLDGALQAIPHDAIDRWWPEHDGDSIAYPHRVEQLELHGPTPTGGQLRAEVRFVGGQDREVSFDVQIWSGEQPWVSMRLVEVLMPKGPLGRLEGRRRRAFIRDRAWVQGASLSQFDGEVTRLGSEQVRQSDWFAGTIAAVYGVDGDWGEQADRIAASEHLARRLHVHPGRIEVDLDAGQARLAGAPIIAYPLALERHEGGEVEVRDAGAPSLDIEHVQRWWREHLGAPEGWLGDDLWGGMIERFIGRVRMTDPGGLANVRGRSVLFLGNHEVQIESLLITILASALTDTVTVTMANAKHERGWVGRLIRDMFGYPEVFDPRNIIYFDKTDPGSMFELLEGVREDVAARGSSLMVHAPGTRAVQAGQRVERISSALLDLAVELELPIVPVYFDGGLPVEPLERGKLEFPVGQTGQDYHFGSPISPAELAGLPYAERRGRVLDGINALAPAPAEAQPNPPRPARVDAIEALRRQRGLGEIDATLLDVLGQLDASGSDARALLALAQDGEQLEARDEDHRAWLAKMWERFASKS